MILLNFCSHHRDIHQIMETSTLSGKEIISLIISTIAAIIALFTLWRSHLMPFKLTICPPTILQVNDPYPSLILTLSFHNSGAQSVLINNLRIRTFKNDATQELELKVQRELTQFQTGILPLDEKNDIAWFVPFVIKGKESDVKRFYFCPLGGKQILFNEVLDTTRIIIDISIQGRWLNNIFNFHYSEFNKKFNANGTITIPKNGFIPQFFNETSRPTTITKIFLKRYRIIKK